ncbi:hypothetical protein J4730_06555 [Klebsiella pneumoniae]|uniref:Uncharacterized protein n=1 Tax=Klebsiella pneumoniae TaxID=573 RepID=A0A939NQ34_KLEPN|nr:hypothetical protein [Klebsiella pneumoniae]
MQGLTVVSNNCGVDGFGLGMLLESRQSARWWPLTSGKTRCLNSWC